MYRFALRPRWVLSHLIVAALAITLVSLGFWQLRRLDDKRNYNDRVRARSALPEAVIDDLLSPQDSALAAARVEFRRVRVTGTFAGNEQVLVRSRSFDDSPGSWVLAPLRTDDGTLVVVNRGWIANNGIYDAVPPDFAVPVGEVTVTGMLMRSQTRGRFGPTDPPTGRLTSLARVDLSRYARQLDGQVTPAWVQQRTIVPAPAASATVPRALGPPELDEGPHFGYAVQWFIFATIALVGYPLILRRNARERAGESGPGRPDPDRADPGDAVEAGDPRLEAHSG